MPQTIEKTAEGQIIAGAFSDPINAKEAVAAFKSFGIPSDEIHVFDSTTAAKRGLANAQTLAGHGFADGHADFYGKTLDDGKVLVAVEGVTDAAAIIDIFDEHDAEFNPNGSRNVRQDVVGLTAGAAAGAVAGGVLGAATGGPIGATVGAAAGAVVGGGAGAAVGTAVEHRK